MEELNKHIDITEYALSDKKINKLYQFYKESVEKNMPEIKKDKKKYYILFQCFLNNIIYGATYKSKIQNIVDKITSVSLQQKQL